MTIRFVSSEEFDAIIKRIDRARVLRKKAKNKKLSLAQKLELLRQAKELEAQNSK